MPAQIRADLRDKELMMNGQAVQSDRAHTVTAVRYDKNVIYKHSSSDAQGKQINSDYSSFNERCISELLVLL